MNRTARFPRLTAEQEQARRRSLRRAERGLRNYVEDLDVEQAGPRCPVCWLLEPHECIDAAMVRS